MLLMSEKPTIIIGSPNDARSVGDGASNGGVKSQALWVKLLRQHGYEAYFVTYDGSQVQWLIEHPPVISVVEAADIIRSRLTRTMTTWLWSAALFDICGRYYLYDEELAFTSDYSAQRYLLEQHLQAGRILKLGTHSRVQAGWYMATYTIAPEYIPEWSDDHVFYPAPAKRIASRIGYFDEGTHTAATIARIQSGLEANDLRAEFLQISGGEAEVRDKLQTCSIVLGMNTGKWRFGEGCPRGQQEAMHCGAVLVSFNVWGNYEYLTDGYTGYMVECGHVDAMTLRVVQLLKNPYLLDQMSRRSTDFAMNAFTPENRWHAVRDFLDLTD